MNRTTARIGCVAALLSASTYGVVACGDDDAAQPSPSKDAGTDSSSSQQDSGSGGGNDSSPPDAGTISVTLKFKAKVGTEDFKCGSTYANQGSTNDTATPRDLRFFVQDVKLLDGSGKETPLVLETRAPWQTPDVALLDFEDGTGKCANGNPELNDHVTGTVPAGNYTGVVFTNGVPTSLNHIDPASETPPLSAGGMTWGWLYGHLFLKAEFASASADGGIGLLHVGSIGCTNSSDGGDDFEKGPTVPCSQPNRNLVKLTSFNHATNTIVLDVKALFALTDLTTSSQCHSDGPICTPLFAKVGLDFDGGARLPTAPAFHVE